MLKLKYNRFHLGVVLLVGILLLLTGCTTVQTKNTGTGDQPAKSTTTTTLNPATIAAAQKALKFYEIISLDQTRAQLEAQLGVPGEVQADGRVAYFDPESGYGVMIEYGEDDTVFAKRLIPNAKSPELAALNPVPVTDKQTYRLAAGMPYYEVQDIMGGDGIEISLSKPEPGSPKQVYGLGWFNPDGSLAIVYLNLPKGEVISSEYIPG
ncbi:MAG: hypothetical protein L6276_11830 [Acetobacterium sp.]|nr:hypothetical protein [Bacillota bacterium]MCG2730943.1 hypothetical protein [Acetobacterium sp.]